MDLTAIEAARFRRMLDDDERELDDAISRHRRARLALGHDPDLVADLERARRAVAAPYRILEAFDDEPLPAELEDAVDGGSIDGKAYNAYVARRLDSARPGLGRHFLRLLTKEGEARDEVERARRREGSETHLPAFRALFASPAGAGRKIVLRRLAGHLIAKGVHPGVVLGLLEAFDAARCRPPIGDAAVGEVVRWVAREEMRDAA